jgi:hypothetical protein
VQVCNEVISSLSPPSRVREGLGVCCITGAQVECCIDLSPQQPPQPPAPPSSKSTNATSSTARDDDDATTGEAAAEAHSGHVQHHAGSSSSSSSAVEAALGDDNRRFMERFWSCVRCCSHGQAAAAKTTTTTAGGCAPPQPEESTTTTTTTSSHGGAPTAWRRYQVEFLVHPKLSHFFLMLWYVCKIEHIVRNYTRYWVETETATTTNRQATQNDIGSLCNLFAEQDDVFEGMCCMFNHGVEHVTESVRAHLAGAAAAAACGAGIS